MQSFFSISGDAVNSLQHLLESNTSALTLTIASRRFSCTLCLASVLTDETRENILSTKALLTGVTGQVRAKVADRGYRASKGKGGELFKCRMLKYTNRKLFSVYRESIFLKWSFFFSVNKRHLSVLFFSFADVISCMVYKG
jgi:hypothetical protein